MSFSLKFSRKFISTALSLMLVMPSFAGTQEQRDAADVVPFVAAQAQTDILGGVRTSVFTDPSLYENVVIDRSQISTLPPVSGDISVTMTPRTRAILMGTDSLDASTVLGATTFGGTNLSSTWQSGGGLSSLGGVFSIRRTSEIDLLYGNCDPASLLPVDMAAFRRITGECIPQQTGSLPDFSRDLNTCACLESDRFSAQGAVFHAARERNPDYSFNAQTQREMNSNIGRINKVLEAEQNAMRFQASTLPASDNGAQFLATEYANKFDFNINRSLTEVRRVAAAKYAERSNLTDPASRPMDPIEIRRPDDNLLTSRPTTPHQCIPMRTHLTGRQMPSDPAFFEDIASLPVNFQSDDWDYEKLKVKFLQEAGQVTDLRSGIANSPTAKKTYLRLQFLERNPLYKNLFAATPSEESNRVKQELYTKIRTAYGNRTATQNERTQAFLELRRGAGELFTRSDAIIAMTKSGSSNNMEKLIRQIPRRVESISIPFNPITTWYQEVERNNWFGMRPTALTSDSALPSTIASMDISISGGMRSPDVQLNARNDAANYANYCQRLTFASVQNQYTVLKELEEDLGEAYSSSPWENQEFANQNIRVCAAPRRSRDGTTTSSFVDYRNRICGDRTTGDCSQENQPAMVAAFLEEFPEQTNGDDDSLEIAALKPFLTGAARVPVITAAGAAKATSDGLSAVVRRRTGAVNSLNAVNQEISDSSVDIEKSINTSNTIATGQKTTPTTGSQTASTPAQNPVQNKADTQNQLLGQVNPDALVPGVPLTPVQTAAVTERDNLRTQVRQSESEASSIRDELVGLRETFERENAEPPAQRDNTLIRDLNDRLGSLEERLEAKDREATDLRRRLARAERQVAETVPQAVTPQVQEDSQRRSPAATTGSVTSGSTQTAQQGGSSGGSINPQAAQLAGSFSQVRGASQARSIVGGQMNAALLSRYGVQSVSQQGRGAIIVAEPGSASSYQQLRADATAGNTVQLNFTEADFTRFSQNEGQALEAYLAQVQNVPGEVVRVVIRVPGSTVPVERFILKSEGKVTIVSEPGASRAPAGSQRYRLSDLVTELQVGR